ncbi:MAG: hypothetical protein ACFWT6_11255 [Virgibacillus proomii]|jgi:hypothetical protein
MLFLKIKYLIAVKITKLPLWVIANTINFCSYSSKNYTGNPIKVSPDIGCTVKKGCSLGHGQTYSTSISLTYGSANGAQKPGIKSSLGINFTKAKATTNSFTFNLAKGQKSYVAFKPYKVKKSIYFKLCGNQGMWCRKLNKKGYARIPRKLSNACFILY